ncbi:hypothetical protein AB835_07875 [Candidatus Endobugula sertula]|uniref:3-hydroxylacyl-ACP dehydratase n=1 Tax=Candidatus Endobugula sertula TaxID=62101 RepID=A0A1D2QPY3_9GAMM|nr:hypothetical protein AB835_07875 [Candidatus Endobugula sertula]
MTQPLYNILDVVPHSGTMSLLDTLINYDNESLSAQLTITEHSCFAQTDGVPAWIGIEYMAQAVAAHAGVLALNKRGDVSIGLLVGTRRYSCNQACFPFGLIINVTVYRELLGDNGLGTYRCEIVADGIEATANLNVFQPDDIDQYLNNKK